MDENMLEHFREIGLADDDEEDYIARLVISFYYIYRTDIPFHKSVRTVFFCLTKTQFNHGFIDKKW
jgi:hypothetical protein